MAFGNGSTTVPSTRIASSLGFASEHHLQVEAGTERTRISCNLGAPNGHGADRKDYLTGCYRQAADDGHQGSGEDLGAVSVIATVCSKWAARRAVGGDHGPAVVEHAGRRPGPR